MSTEKVETAFLLGITWGHEGLEIQVTPREDSDWTRGNFFAIRTIIRWNNHLGEVVDSPMLDS